MVTIIITKVNVYNAVLHLMSLPCGQHWMDLCLVAYVNSKGSAKPAHLCGLARAFPVHHKDTGS